MSSTILGLAPGNWAEWFGAVAAALAFGVTSLAIWLNHRLRLTEHAEAMFDEALKVTATVGQGSEYVTVSTDQGNERKPIPKVAVVVRNLGRRPITNVEVEAHTRTGIDLGHSSVEFIQAGLDCRFQFDPVDSAYAPFGTNPSVNVMVMLTFEDINETKWMRGPPSDRLLRFPKQKRWHSQPGNRHVTRPESPT